MKIFLNFVCLAYAQILSFLSNFDTKLIFKQNYFRHD